MSKNSEKKKNSRSGKPGKDHSGKHHIIPTSRGGVTEPSNLYAWKGDHGVKHNAWHALFVNALPEEVVALILTWERKDGELDMRYFRKRNGINAAKLNYWHILFSEMKPREAIAWVTREFIEKPWVKENKEQLRRKK